jgi:hypothetical protein
VALLRQALPELSLLGDHSLQFFIRDAEDGGQLFDEEAPISGSRFLEVTDAPSKLGDRVA